MDEHRDLGASTREALGADSSVPESGATTTGRSGTEAGTDHQAVGASGAAGPPGTAGKPGTEGSARKDRPRRAHGRPRRRRAVVEWVVLVAVSLSVALALRTWVVQAFFIPSGSMEPTLMIGDRILVDKLSYDFHPVHTGDIIVFRAPRAEHCEPGVDIHDLVKRVIGLPGQFISSGPHGEVFINHHLLSQPWLTASARADPGIPIQPQTIPAGRYFVMGDNRGISCDSRYWGTVPRHDIIGRVVARIWPASRFKLFGW